MFRDEARLFRNAGRGPCWPKRQCVTGLVVLAATAFGQTHLVTAVRTWTLAEATRVAIEVSGPFEYKYDRLHNPERVYFDIKGAVPAVEGRRIWNKEVVDKLKVAA